ncbi:LuxR C-terminal-related transcriptional regulator [Streptomyces sp. NBC_00045]|uniref:LuxR C-terminal-related transcriptional regulator n=1 Tax=Streptomyces sp. NBC_00045 TaxID=2975625 RepID=UPI00386F223B
MSGVTPGHSKSETAARMCISRRTVSTHVSNILRKLGLTRSPAGRTVAVTSR